MSLLTKFTKLMKRETTGPSAKTRKPVWIIDESVPPDTRVVLKRPELRHSGNTSKLSDNSPKEKSTTHFPEEAIVSG